MSFLFFESLVSIFTLFVPTAPCFLSQTDPKITSCKLPQAIAEDTAE